MPIGMLGIADFLYRNHINTEIIHEKLEKILNKNFSLEKYVKEQNVNICCFDLNWHQQSKNVIDTVKRLKKSSSNIKIIIGGFTASRFAKEIVKKFKDIDYVIKGDAELPLLMLCKSMLGMKKINLNKIPNLVYRNDNHVIENKIRHQAGTNILGKISYANFGLIKNSDSYLRLRKDSEDLKKEKCIYFSAGRGCSETCLFCGGSRYGQQKYNNRPLVKFIPVNSTIKSLQKFSEQGIKIWNSCFDPNPNLNYYSHLFKKIREKNIKLTHYFDCFSLPSEKFIDDFKKTFTNDSCLNISPETGSESLRKHIRSFFYTNEELLLRLGHIAKLDIRTSVYFSTGLPFETKKDVKTTINLIKILRKRFPKIIIYVNPIDLEPGSIIFDHQNRFGIKSSLKSFEDIINAQKQPREINFSTKSFSGKTILKNAMDMRLTRD